VGEASIQSRRLSKVAAELNHPHVFRIISKQIFQDSWRHIGAAVIDENDLVGLAYFPEGDSQPLEKGT
jgi:hypothetical protein